MHMTVLDKFLAVVLIAIGVYAGWLFLDDLQYGSLRFDAGWTPPTATQQLVAVRFCTYTSSFW